MHVFEAHDIGVLTMLLQAHLHWQCRNNYNSNNAEALRLIMS